MAKKKLRTGFTTGAAAAAATKGALIYLLENRVADDVGVEFLTGEKRRIPIFEVREKGPGRAVCKVVKDAGDDPDVTNGAEIGVTVSLGPSANGDSKVVISGGEGVGTVTKPGLEVPVGEPAINSGPRKMIEASALEVLERNAAENRRVKVEVFVPEGERLSKKTLNKRLGVLGGISILGTTGLVRPMSHEAYTASIDSALSVASATGLKRAVFTTGRRSERCAQDLLPDLPPEAFVQIGDFFQHGLQSALKFGFETITLAVFFGKAVKMAQEAPCTHAAKTALSLEALSRWCIEDGCPEELARTVLGCNTAREAFFHVIEQRPSVIDRVGEKMIRAAEKFGDDRMRIDAVIFDFDEKPVWRSGQGRMET